MPTLTIDGRRVAVAAGTTVLGAAREAGIEIPTLCHHEALEPTGACRLCVVDVTRPGWDGWYKLVVSCMFEAEDGLIVRTDTDRARQTREVVLDLLLARCPGTELIRRLAASHGIERTSYVENPEPTDCILCGLCTRVCDHIGVSAIAATGRGVLREITPPFGEPPPDCIGCLSCAEICPTGHIRFEPSVPAADGLRRRIWGKDFEMLQCTACGAAHVTAAQARHFSQRTGVPDSYFATCDRCKRKAHAGMAVSLGELWSHGEPGLLPSRADGGL